MSENAEQIVSVLGVTDTVARDLLRLLIGEPLGVGVYRRVYELAWRPDLVVKVESDAGNFMNVLEWETWREMKGSKWEPYFAPCEGISANGSALIMKRTRPISKFPSATVLPSFLQDVKPENFGRLNGRIVCHDYGISNLIRSNVRGAKLKTVAALTGAD